MTPGVLLVLQEERLVDGGVVWEEVVSPVDFIPTWVHKVRLLIRGLPEGYTFVMDKDFWMVREEHVDEGPFIVSAVGTITLGQLCCVEEEGEYLS